MTKFHIHSKAGVDMGVYEGETKAEALAAMHRDAGYEVSLDDDGELAFKSDDDRQICGGVESWDLDEA